MTPPRQALNRRIAAPPLTARITTKHRPTTYNAVLTNPLHPSQPSAPPTLHTMSASNQNNAATSKAGAEDATKNGDAADKKPAAQLEEDDEFEDFPAEGT